MPRTVPCWLPDSRARWEAIWRLRDELEEIAHSHPVGPLGFSAEDETTMAALTEALGRPVRFSVVAPDGMVVREDGRDFIVTEEPAWAGHMRADSGMSSLDHPAVTAPPLRPPEGDTRRFDGDFFEAHEPVGCGA